MPDDDRPDWMRRCEPDSPPLTDEELGTLLIGAGVVVAIGGVVALLGLGLAFGWLTNPPWPVRVVSALVLALAEWASP